MSDAIFRAPNGCAIKGTSETIPGTCGVVFYGPDPAKDFDHDGHGTDVAWDGQATFEIDGVIVFVDEEGAEWLPHHLISADAEPLSDAAITAARAEIAAGRVLTLAKHVQRQAGIINSFGCRNAAEQLIGFATAHYAQVAATAAKLKTIPARADT